MKSPTWIDDTDGTYSAGEMGFLIETSNDYKGMQLFRLSERPAYTNISREPRARGWCGTHNDTATYGRGVWRVAKVTNGRLKIERVTDRAALETWLESVGYPALLEACVEGE